MIKFQNEISIPWPSDYLPLKRIEIERLLKLIGWQRMHQKLMIIKRTPLRGSKLLAFLNIKQPGSLRLKRKVRIQRDLETGGHT